MPSEAEGGAGARLVGRRREREELDRLVADVLAGTSRVAVLRGEAGVGKSALLGYLAERVAGWRLARVAGVESEMELAYSGLHLLCAPMLDHLDRLPVPQRDALATVFGLRAGPARIALVCAARTEFGGSVLAGLPELPVEGLNDRDARALLLDNVYGPIDPAVCDQIIAESHGNPLALLELPRTRER